MPKAVTVGGGVAAALALGLGFGFLAKPDLIRSAGKAPMHPAAVSEDNQATPKMNIEVNRPPPAPVVKPAGPLEVLPPDMARNASRPIGTSMPAVTGISPQALTPNAPRLAVAPAPPHLVQVETPAPLAPPRLAPPPHVAVPASDGACDGARTRAAQMVCADPDLSAADRELNRAYRRAMRAGVPQEQLRQEQRDWLAIREDAARRSPRAVASVYDQRIDELNQIADDGPG
jgi:uncharacterized protein YecT (DUF1311 family)